MLSRRIDAVDPVAPEKQPGKDSQNSQNRRTMDALIWSNSWLLASRGYCTVQPQSMVSRGGDVFQVLTSTTSVECRITASNR